MTPEATMRPLYLSHPLPHASQRRSEGPRAAQQGGAGTRAHPKDSVPDSRALTRSEEETAMTAAVLTMTITGWASADAQIRYTPSGTMLATATGRPRVRAWTSRDGQPRATLALDARTWGTQPPRPGRQPSAAPVSDGGWSRPAA